MSAFFITSVLHSQLLLNERQVGNKQRTQLDSPVYAILTNQVP
jgi:hypothetical protein